MSYYNGLYPGQQPMAGSVSSKTHTASSSSRSQSHSSSPSPTDSNFSADLNFSTLLTLLPNHAPQEPTIHSVLSQFTDPAQATPFATPPSAPAQQPDYSQGAMALKIMQLTHELSSAKAALTERQQAYDTLLSSYQDAVGHKRLAPPFNPSPSRADFPRTRFWNKPTADTWQQEGNGGLAFIVDATGEFIGKDRVAMVIETSKQIFQELQRAQDRTSLMADSLPLVWGDAGILIITHFANSIESAFFELTLCSDHWKAKQVATIVYPEWIKRRGKGIKDSTKRQRSESVTPSMRGSSVVHDEDRLRDGDVDDDSLNREQNRPMKRPRVATDTERSRAPLMQPPPPPRQTINRMLALQTLQSGPSNVAASRAKPPGKKAPIAKPVAPVAAAGHSPSTSTSVLPPELPHAPRPAAPEPQLALRPASPMLSPPAPLHEEDVVGLAGSAQPTSSSQGTSATESATPNCSGTTSKAEGNDAAESSPAQPSSTPSPSATALDAAASDATSAPATSSSAPVGSAVPVQPAKKRWTMVSNPQTAETRARMFWAGTLSATDRPDWNGFTAWLSTAEGKAMFATEQQKIKEAKDAKKTARATTTA